MLPALPILPTMFGTLTFFGGNFGFSSGLAITGGEEASDVTQGGFSSVEEACTTFTGVSSPLLVLLHWFQYLSAIGLVAFFTASTDITGGGGFFGGGGRTALGCSK